MAKGVTQFDPGDESASVLSYTDADSAKAPAGVCCYLSGTTAVPVDATNRLPVTLGLTDAELRATAVPVSLTSTTVTGTVAVTQSTSPWVVSLASTTITGSVATTVADGSDVAMGARADSAATSDTGTFSLIGLFKRLLSKLTSQLPAALTGSGNLKVAVSEALPAGTNAVGTVTAVGAAAHDAPASGNPVLVAGAANDDPVTLTTVSSGDAVRATMTTRGSQWVTLCSSGGQPNSGANPLFITSQGGIATLPNFIDDLLDLTGTPAGSYFGGGVNGAVIAWSNLRDSSGNELASATTTPGASDRGLVVRQAGTVSQPAPTTPTLSNVSASASSVTVLAANSSRLTATVYNDSSAILYLKFGTTASTTSFTLAMAAGSYAEFPKTLYGTGIVTGIWASATGAARVTEYV